MKQLTCEMCGSTDLVKQDGFFVCQTCGCKYSVEEAKKMMIEGTVNVQGDVRIKNAAQLENLLNLAESSFNSENYKQAEEFCNQIIAMDATNYMAWKLKGEAINYQITSNNPRILEVYNCIMTSYDILNDDEKEEKKSEILSSLKTCFEGEIRFWVKQIETNRPTESSLNDIKNSYVDSFNKMSDAFMKLDYEDEIRQGYLCNFVNYFIKIVNETVVSAWKTTVAYNYYRDKVRDGKWIDENYRPNDSILSTFISEGDVLISLLNYAANQFNELTDSEQKALIYENIAFIHKQLCYANSYTRMVSTTTVYGHTSQSYYWQLGKSLTKEAVELRKKYIADCEAKAKTYRDEAVQRKLDYEERKKNERIAAYWNAHQEEKNNLDNRKKDLESIKEKAIAKISELQKEKEKVPSLDLLIKKQKEIESLETQKKALGLLKFKEKGALQGQINVLNVEKNAIKEKVTEEQQEIEKEIAPIRTELNDTIALIAEIDDILTRDRDGGDDDEE